MHTYGFLGLAAIIFLTLYFIRKRTYRYGVGSSQKWLQAHLYIGILCVILILMHSSPPFTGSLSIALLVLFLLVIISGIVGSLIYSIIPLQLTKYGREVKTKDEIMMSIQNYIETADRLVLDTSEDFKKMYHKNIRPLIRSKKTNWEYMFLKETEIIMSRMKMIERCRKKLMRQDMYELDMLSSLLVEKEKLSFMLMKINLHGIWLNFHLPLSSALIMATLIHIWSILYF
jgi:hypothetical protein